MGSDVDGGTSLSVGLHFVEKSYSMFSQRMQGNYFIDAAAKNRLRVDLDSASFSAETFESLQMSECTENERISEGFNSAMILARHCLLR